MCSPMWNESYARLTNQVPVKNSIDYVNRFIREFDALEH